MTRTVKNVDGPDVELVTLKDLLASERALHRWVIGSFGVIVVTAVSLGVLYGKMVSDVSQIGRRVEEIRAEGSVPLKELREALAVIDERQKINSAHIAEIQTLLSQSQAALLRIEIGMDPRAKR
jgi:hypothetical protein